MFETGESLSAISKFNSVIEKKSTNLQNTDGFRCEFHLLTLRFINNSLQSRTLVEKLRLGENPIIIKMHIISQHSRHLYMVN